MISIGSLHRAIAVYAVIVAMVIGEWPLAVHGSQLFPGFAGRIAAGVGLIVLLGVAVPLTNWERRRRREDKAAVRRVLEAARSLGVVLEEDRAIFPVFYRGRRPVRE